MIRDSARLFALGLAIGGVLTATMVVLVVLVLS